MDQQKGYVSNLLEHSWFFGNTLKNISKSPKIMVRSNSHPCASSNTKDVTLVSQDHDSSKMSNLPRSPSLPISLGKDAKYDLTEEEDDDDEPRMSDLIIQAMPISKSSRKLDRMSSLPLCRGPNEASSIASNVQKSGKFCRKVSVESPALLQEKGPIAMTKLTSRASIDSSMLLPPKYTSKGTKQSGSKSKNRTLEKQGPSNMDNPDKNDQPKIQTLDKSKSQKSPTDIETEELQGFKDLGFSFHQHNVSPNKSQLLHGLQRGTSLDSKVKRPYFSKAGPKSSSSLSCPPLVPKWSDKDSPTQDLKAQIKFWARAVASNVHQEC